MLRSSAFYLTALVVVITVGTSLAQAKPALALARQQVRQASQLLNAADDGAGPSLAEGIADSLELLSSGSAGEDSVDDDDDGDRVTRQLDSFTGAIRGALRLLAVDLNPIASFFRRIAPEIDGYLRFARRFCAEWPRFTRFDGYGQLNLILDATCGSRLFRIQPPSTASATSTAPSPPPTSEETINSSSTLTSVASTVEDSASLVTERSTEELDTGSTTVVSSEVPGEDAATEEEASESTTNETEALIVSTVYASKSTISPEQQFSVGSSSPTSDAPTTMSSDNGVQAASNDNEDATEAGTRNTEQQPRPVIRVYMDENGVLHIVRPDGAAPARVIQHVQPIGENLSPAAPAASLV